jgi:hypothetical protein
MAVEHADISVRFVLAVACEQADRNGYRQSYRRAYILLG